MHFVVIATKHNGRLEAAQALIIDDRYDVFNVVLLDGSIESHKAIYMVVASLLCTQSLRAVQFCFVPIDTKHNGPIQMACIQIDDDGYIWLNVVLLACPILISSGHLYTQES